MCLEGVIYIFVNEYISPTDFRIRNKILKFFWYVSSYTRIAERFSKNLTERDKMILLDKRFKIL